MVRQKNKNTVNPLVAVFIVIVVVLLAIFVVMRKGLPSHNSTQTIQSSIPSIQSANDLNAIDAELDNTDLSELDRESNQLDSDTSGF